MNRWNIRFLLILPFLLTGSLGVANNGSENIADSLAGIEKFDAARVAYEYAIFSCKSDSIKNLLLIKKANCYWNKGMYDEAIKTLDRVDKYLLEESTKLQILKKQIYCMFMLGRYTEVDLGIAHYYSNDSANNTAQKELELITLCKHYLNEDYELFFETINHSDSPPKVNYDSLITTKKNKLLRRKKWAKTMSCILPGSGQFIAGKYKQGLASASVVGGLGTYITLSVIKQHYITAIAGGLPFFIQFYAGGIKYVSKHYDQELQSMYKRESKSILLNLIENQH